MILRVKQKWGKPFNCSFFADQENKSEQKHVKADPGETFECPDIIAEKFLRKYPERVEKADGDS